MVKKEMNKMNIYILAIVSIVAVVGIVVLVLNAGNSGVYVSESDLVGEATATKVGYTGTFEESFTKLAGIKKVKAVTDIAYISIDGIGGLATIFPVTTTEGRSLLTKTSVLSATEKKNTFSIIVDMKNKNNIIAIVTHTGEIKGYSQDDIALIVGYSSFLGIGGDAWFAVNPVYDPVYEQMVDPGRLEQMVDPDSLQELFTALGENTVFWTDCKVKCYPDGTCDVVC